MTSLENHEGNREHSSEKMTYGKDAIEWRRARVLELDSQGYTHREIVAKLQIAKGTVSNDLAYLRKQAQQNLQHHIHETIPEEYQKCMTGIKRNLKQTLEIAESTADPRIKLQARAIANDCYKYIMELTTDGVVISDAIRFVQTNKDKLTVSASRKDDNKESKEPDYDEDNDQLEESQEEETRVFDVQETTNQVF